MLKTNLNRKAEKQKGEQKCINIIQIKENNICMGNNYNDRYNIYHLNECINNNHLFCTGTPATKYVLVSA